MGQLSHRLEIGDTVYTVDEHIKDYPTGTKCSFCGGTGILLTGQRRKASCNAGAWPYKCIRGEIHRMIPFFEACAHVISGVSVSKRFAVTDAPTLIISESYCMDDGQRWYDSDEFFENYEQAAALARKNNELQISLLDDPD